MRRPITEYGSRLRREGKLRLGDTVPTAEAKTRPVALDHWRLTSANRGALEHAARMYGGAVTEWDGHPGQYELFTTADELFVRLLPGAPKQSYEFWSNGGCLRRCDGTTCELLGQNGATEAPCQCDEDTPSKQACKLTTRLQVELAGVPCLGYWLMETASFYAAEELPPVIRFLNTRHPGALCILAIERRESKRAGEQKKQFVVPTLRIREGMREAVAALGGADVGALVAPEPVPAALPASAPVAESVDVETGEVPATPEEIAKAKQDRVLDILRSRGWNKKAHEEELNRFKSVCANAPLDWQELLIRGVSEGLKDLDDLYDFACDAVMAWEASQSGHSTEAPSGD